MREEFSKQLSFVAGALIVVLLAAVLGGVIAKNELWPYRPLMQAKFVLTSLIQNGEVVADGRQSPAPAGASRERVLVRAPGRAVGEGFYALLAWDGERSAYSVFLHDATGAQVHKWPIDEMAFFDQAEHRSNRPHAMEVLADGSVLIGFDALGVMARLDACGQAIWTRDGYFHHSFSQASDGGVWTWYSPTSSYSQIQRMLKFDPETGADLASLSLNDDVIKASPENALFFSMKPDDPFDADGEDARDIFHPNDVEELSPAMADAFEMFEAGDLLISIRELNMVAVVSPTGEMKWSQRGPWLKQHDPDFQPDGRISVFNNSQYRASSSIISIEPGTRHGEDMLPYLSAPFKSETRGKHQMLPNGNILITIPAQGQVLEVTPEGAIAIEFNNVSRHDITLNEDIANAKWLPADFFSKTPGCAT